MRIGPKTTLLYGSMIGKVRRPGVIPNRRRTGIRTEKKEDITLYSDRRGTGHQAVRKESSTAGYQEVRSIRQL